MDIPFRCRIAFHRWPKWGPKTPHETARIMTKEELEVAVDAVSPIVKTVNYIQERTCPDCSLHQWRAV